MSQRAVMRVIGAVLLACGIFVSAARAAEEPPSPPLDRLVADVCAKPVVLLGEDAYHGGGRTLEVKTRLMQRLIDECGYSAVFFESPLYDFIDLSHAFATGTATPERLADALGGLWSTTAEIDPLVEFLHAKAAAGKVRLAGLGPGLGESTALYARKRMPKDLVRELRDPRRRECESALMRYGDWDYDDEHPYDAHVEAQLNTCARDIVASFFGRSGARAEEERFMAMNMARHFAMSSVGGKDPWAQRDRAMADNFAWQRARLPGNAKVIVWCATMHAAKRLPPGSMPGDSMGSYLVRTLGRRMAVIGFTASSGSIAPAGRPLLDLPLLPTDAIEQRVFGAADGEFRYLDRERLHAFGIAPARALDETGVQRADWSTVLDGLLVMRKERPVRRVRVAKPQQAAGAPR